MITQCKKKKARDFYKKAKIPTEDISSLANSALNVELVYVILVGINTITENQKEPGL